MPEATQKICTKCQAVVPLDGFHKRKTGKYGRSSRCKKCTNKPKPAAEPVATEVEPLVEEGFKNMRKMQIADIYEFLRCNNIHASNEDSWASFQFYCEAMHINELKKRLFDRVLESLK